MSIDGQPAHDTIPFDPGARDLGVVVGFDGSPNSTQALRYGADIAARRGALLTVITTYRAPVPVYGAYAALPAQREDEANRRRAETALDEAAALLEGHRGEVSYVTAEGDSVGALADASANAQLLVVGARGRGGFLGLVRGSVATTLPAHARCPTIVVPGEGQDEPVPSTAPVVVGIDECDRGEVAALDCEDELVSGFDRHRVGRAAGRVIGGGGGGGPSGGILSGCGGVVEGVVDDGDDGCGLALRRGLVG